MNNPMAGAYLRWSYKKAVEDIKNINPNFDFYKKDFSCLLCGVGNKKTAEEFIRFVLVKNIKTKIWIIDINEDHLVAIRKLVDKKYKDKDINIIRVDALDLQSIIDLESIDWIETDAFWEFFDKVNLLKLLNVWSLILKREGFISTRDYVCSGLWNIIMDPVRNFIMEGWLGVKIYKHKQEDFDDVFNEVDFKATISPTFIPTYKRFLLVKE